MKKILLLLSTVVLSLLLLCACFPIGNSGSGNSDTGKDGDGENKPSDITEIQVVFSAEEKYAELIPIITDALNTIDTVSASFAIDSTDAKKTEIVFGKTNREITTEAYRLLSRMNEINDGECRLLIYSDGNSVAIAFDEDLHGIGAAAEEATEYFLDNYVRGKSSFAVKSGTLYSGAVDPIEYQREKDLSERDEAITEKLEKIEDKSLKEEIALAIKEYYGLMSSDMLIWLANLYDPEIGGFYYSNSARDTDGYLPDIESTAQALTIIRCCGILDQFGNSEFNEIVGKAIVSFIKPMQDPNGYFYHPQWGKAMTDKLVERRARDLSNAVSCLNGFGAKPTYDTPTGVKGDGIILSSALTVGLGGDGKARAVSRVVLAEADYVSPALLDEASFRAYLEAGNIKNNGYGFGSELSSQLSEIIHRDSQLKEAGADYSLCDILINYLNENQNPDNGVWYWVDKSNPDYSYYAGVNGLLKISGIYTAVGKEIPNATAAAKTAIEAIYSDENPVGIVDIYNAWFSVENVIKNLSKCSPNKEIGDAKVAELRNALLSDAPVAIRATMHKLSLFRKPDGSFSYLQKQSSSTSSGMPVAVPGTNEGDVNATVIGGLDTGDRMFFVLGLSVPELYGEADYYKFIDELKNLNPVQKKPEPEREPISFDYDGIGELPTEVQISGGAQSTAEIIADPRSGNDGNVLCLSTVPGSNLTVDVSSGSSSVGDNCLVFETEMCVLSGKSGYAVQIYLGESYMLCLRLDENGVNFFDSSSPSSNKIDIDFCASIPYGEWFKLRIEYYPGTHETVRAKTYLNGSVIAVTDNYYDYYGHKINDGTGTPASYYPYARIFAMSSSEFEMLIDNVLSEKVKASYESFTDPDGQPVVNIDAPEREELVYDFTVMPEDITVNSNSDIITLNNGELIFSGGSSTGFTLDVPQNIRVGGANCSVLEAVARFDSLTDGAIVEIRFTEMSYNESPVVIYHLKTVKENGKHYLKLYEASGGTTGALLGEKVIAAGESFKLKIEFYKNEGATLIYINDRIIAMSSVTCTGANKYTVGKLKITNLAKSSFVLALDSLKFERDLLSFEEAVEPEIDRNTVDFENDEEYTLGGGASIVDDGGNKKASLSGNTAFIDLFVNKRSDVSSATVLSLNLEFAESSKNGFKTRISLRDTEGAAILVYELSLDEGKVLVREVSETTVYSAPIAEFLVNKGCEFKIEYYPSRETIHIYVGKDLVGVSSLTYQQSFGEIDSVRISSHSSTGVLTVDNVYLESLNKLFVPMTIIVENEEDTAEKITFDASCSGNLPSRLTVSLSSGGAAVKVKEMMIDGVGSKALVLQTNKGGIDTVKIKASVSPSNAKAMILDARLKCDFNGSVYTYFCDAKGNQIYRINFNVDAVSEGSGVRIDDNSGLGASYGYGTLGNPLSGKTKDEWFDLRIELVNPDGGNIEARIFVDGTLFAISTEGAWAGKNALDIAMVDFSSGISAAGNFCIDEITLVGGAVTPISK